MKNMVASLPVSLQISEIFLRSSLLAPALHSARARLEYGEMEKWKLIRKDGYACVEETLGLGEDFRVNSERDWCLPEMLDAQNAHHVT